MIILALDPGAYIEDLDEWLSKIIDETKDLVVGYKVGLPLLIAGGLEAYRTVREKAPNNLLIADLKLADVGDIMSMSIDHLSKTGVDAIIAHSFIGYKDALDKLSMKCFERNIKLILVISMSHRGSEEYIDRHVNEFIELTDKTGAWGIVAPATRPEIIKNVRERIGGKIKIFSPGIGFQGAEPGTAICHGADYEIIGRAVTTSSNPREKLLEILEVQREVIKRCKRS
ncbi:MAG: orotidine-5'-phosphate decarboxylase [Desulfurococcaceae archaeon]|nr:orotidine-5'-phosphate decarboxylase [Desulfurococcaceae archaeon]